jgi:hypothetical protein
MAARMSTILGELSEQLAFLGIGCQIAYDLAFSYLQPSFSRCAPMSCMMSRHATSLLLWRDHG